VPRAREGKLAQKLAAEIVPVNLNGVAGRVVEAPVRRRHFPRDACFDIARTLEPSADLPDRDARLVIGEYRSAGTAR
jgi:methyl coenzyme M reductase subunit C-like uncharacterized protein (methanogenesis marker protein 7)